MLTKKTPGFYKKMLKKEFVIDEPREIVFNQDVEHKLSQIFDAQQKKEEDEKPDLLNDICEVLLEREKLENIAESLRKQNEQSKNSSIEPMIRSVLPLLDSFDRIIRMAQEHPPSEEVQNWIKSIASMQSRMLQMYEKYGLRVMDPVGEKVNLDRHEVVEVLHTDSIPNETIVEVRQKGYALNNKILRDAKVVVAQNERG
ncbi:MAG: nucleotide exchange factor GrpE [Candidatus Sumerlaeia bacterium]